MANFNGALVLLVLTLLYNARSSQESVKARTPIDTLYVYAIKISVYYAHTVMWLNK